ncbi:MAG: 50S ribosomal protein L4, partial [Chloroflexi bacterium]
MASAPVVDQSGVRTGSLELSAEIFDCTVNGPVMHQALLRQLANGRQGTHDTLNRREVRGGG